MTTLHGHNTTARGSGGCAPVGDHDGDYFRRDWPRSLHEPSFCRYGLQWRNREDLSLGRNTLVPLFRAHRTTRSWGLASLGVAAVLALLLFNGSPTQAAQLPPGGTFIDDGLNTHEGFIEATAEIGVTSGCEVDEYCPTVDVTREQVASFIARALGLPVPASDYFTDDAGSVHESNINRLAEAGISLGCGETSFCRRIR